MFCVVAVPPPLVAFPPACTTVNCVEICGSGEPATTLATSNVPLKLASVTPAIVTCPPLRNGCAAVVVKVTTPPERTAPLAAIVRESVPFVL